MTDIHVPCVPQRYVMWTLAVTGTTFSWMVYYSGYRNFQEYMADQPTMDRGFTTVQYHPTLDGSAKLPWTTALQASVREVFWAAHAVSGVVGGLLMDSSSRPKGVWAVGGVVTSLSSITLPHLIRISPLLALGMLLVSGMGFGMMCPGQSAVVAHWVPENDRTSAVALIESGLFLGVMISVALHDSLAALGGKWETWVHITCVLTLLWVLVWYLLFHNRPSEHTHISPRELQYLVRTTVGVRSRQALVTVTRRNNAPFTIITSPDVMCSDVPWKDMLLSPPLLSLQLFNVGFSWTQSLLMYQLNRYITHMFSVSSRTFPGVYLPALALGIAFVSTILHGWVSDQLIKKRLTSRTANRRMFLSLPSYMSACFLFAISFLGSSKGLFLIIFYILIHFQFMSYAPMNANVVDLAPNYSGLLRGFLSAGTSLTILLSREAVDIIVEDVDDMRSWNTVFQISAAILLVCSTPYLFFGSGKIQQWNNFTKLKPQDENEETNGEAS